MTKRVKKSPPGKVRIKVRVNTDNLTPEERVGFPKLPGVIEMSGWVSPRIADNVLRALFAKEEDVQ